MLVWLLSCEGSSVGAPARRSFGTMRHLRGSLNTSWECRKAGQQLHGHNASAWYGYVATLKSPCRWTLIWCYLGARPSRDTQPGEPPQPTWQWPYIGNCYSTRQTLPFNKWRQPLSYVAGECFATSMRSVPRGAKATCMAARHTVAWARPR